MRLLVALLAAATLHLAGGAASGDGFGSKPHIVVRAMLQRPPLRAPAAPCSALLSNPRTAHQFFVVDDLGWHNVGWHNPDMITPNAVALVAEGIDLDRHCARPQPPLPQRA